MTPGVSETTHLTLPVQSYGPTGGAVVIETPIPAGRARTGEKAARRTVQPIPTNADRPSARPSASQGRGPGIKTPPADRPLDARGTDPQSRAPRTVGVPRPALTSSLFAAQLLGQEDELDGNTDRTPSAPQRSRGHDAYRRTGGEPPIFPDDAAVFSFAV